MGYGLGIYCEQEIFYKKELIEELNKKFPPYGEYTSFASKTGYYFFGNYRIEHEKSWFYQICKSIDSDLFEFFAKLDYVEDLAEWMEKGIEFNWLNLSKAKLSLNDFAEKIKSKDPENIFEETSKEIDDYYYDRFKKYFSTEDGIKADLSKCQYYIEIFERHGAKKILFIYD